jgi:hypothetical protein
MSRESFNPPGALQAKKTQLCFAKTSGLSEARDLSARQHRNDVGHVFQVWFEVFVQHFRCAVASDPHDRDVY